VLLANKKTNRPARCDSPAASTPSKPRVPQRLPKGTADVIKLANRYSSLEEMSMDLGGASPSSPNKGKHKEMATTGTAEAYEVRCMSMMFVCVSARKV